MHIVRNWELKAWRIYIFIILEEADLDFKSLKQALADSHANGRILCESPVMEVDALKFRNSWMKISGEKLD